MVLCSPTPWKMREQENDIEERESSFHPVDMFQGIRAPFPLPHQRPQFCRSGISHGFHAPLPLNVQIGPGHGLPQFQPNGNFLGIHAPFSPTGLTGAFQRTFPEFMGPGDPMLEKDIRELLFSLRPPRIAVESLAKMYIQRYGKTLRIEGFRKEGQQHVKAGCCLTGLLMRLTTTRVIKRQGQHYIVLVEDVPKYLAHGFSLVIPGSGSDSNQIYITFFPESTFTEEDVRSYFRQEKHHIVPVEDAPKYLAHDFKLVMPPASSDSKRIYLTFVPESTFTEEDVWKYFSHYGPVNDVRNPFQERRMFGYVSSLYPKTVKQILSERSPRAPHFICGYQVLVKPYKEKHDLGKLAREITSVIYEHHTGEHLSNDHKLFAKWLNNTHDLGIVTEQASPPRHNLSFHSDNEAGRSQADNKAESSRVKSVGWGTSRS